MKAIIVTHPNRKFKAVLHGLDIDRLRKLAELRALQGNVLKRFKIVAYKDDTDLAIKTAGINKYRLTMENYKWEISNYYHL